MDAFHRGLAETGFAEGRDVRIEFRLAAGDYERLPSLAAELVQLSVDVIVAVGGTLSVMAAKAATDKIPIVILSGDDADIFKDGIECDYSAAASRNVRQPI